MEYDLFAAGFPLVEIMRRDRGVDFEQPGVFLGPYPSADVCILLDVAAKLGKRCCFAGPAGDDAFGRVVENRLRKDGVDITHMRRVPGAYTAAVFVRYEADGSREYMDFIANSACGAFGVKDVHPDTMESAGWIHFSGEVISNCAAGDMRRGIEAMLQAVPAEAKVSLDPNFTLDITGMRDLFDPFVQRADLILPSKEEARMLMDTPTDEQACEMLAAAGKTVALKQGEKGCRIYRGGEVVSVPAFTVEEVDPTGCGDSFCAGFLYGMMEGWPLEKTGRFANAVGALQATAFGPMEGACTLDEVEAFIRQNS